MAKRVIWSLRAQRERKLILQYWRDRNKSLEYSRKLNQLFEQAVLLISDHPQIGKQTDRENIRIKIIKDYLMFYEINERELKVLTIWDSRQDADKLPQF